MPRINKKLTNENKSFKEGRYGAIHTEDFRNKTPRFHSYYNRDIINNEEIARQSKEERTQLYWHNVNVVRNHIHKSKLV